MVVQEGGGRGKGVRCSGIGEVYKRKYLTKDLCLYYEVEI